MSTDELLEIGRQWFKDQKWQPFPFQLRTWEAFLKGQNGLLNAPTGTGKTYALWMPFLLHIIDQHQRSGVIVPGLKLIWITPLKALAQEIQQATLRVVEDLDLPLRIGVRTGDTSSSVRAKQRKEMPDMLITTPESLHILMSNKGSAVIFKDLIGIVVDEWHELLGSKRGVQVELSLSRIRLIAPGLRIWGISATIGNLEQARQVLLGPETPEFQNSILIRSGLRKKTEVKSILPQKMDTFPWRGHMGLRLLGQAAEIINGSSSTLLFCNTRNQCEQWFQSLLEAHPYLAGTIAMHHGSIARDTRIWVENALRLGKLKAVVCTSSLDLGVDFTPVETVIQIGGPKGVARFLQRAGRSGHQPYKTSKIYFLPTHAMELIEASALREAAHNQSVEDRIPYLNSLDVLIQYLLTLAVSDGFYPAEILAEIRQTFCYQAITEEQWQWVLNFITRGSQSLQAYDEYKRVAILEDGKFQVKHRRVALQHRLQIGTIVGDNDIQVKYQRGKLIGTIEELFISKLNIGDAFTFAGRNLELLKVSANSAYVRNSRRKDTKVPAWMGGRMSFSARMSHLLREELYQVHQPEPLSEELKALAPVFQRQNLESCIPTAEEFLIERFKTREGYHLLFYPFEGRFVHEAMASLFAYRLGRDQPITFSMAYNDYGFELLSDQELHVHDGLWSSLLDLQNLIPDFHRSINASEIARRKFRDIAVISGLVFTGYPGKNVKMKHLQSSSQLLFEVFRDYEPENLLFKQAFLEAFEHQLEEGRLIEAMQRLTKQQVRLQNCLKATPFSFPIITDRMRERMSSEKLLDRIKKMTAVLTKV